ncbi:RcnB family protein [Sphingobium estronivorans]|uniref:RcnB family protein n=1 Tax=Sphingobium estronivorans TaxID=1577690 RepID=UPI00123AC86F|nr:RcnB family protein [Sphingobium estronivorans]
MMKKFLMALAATTMVASPMITAQAQAAPHREETRIVKHGPHGRTVVKHKTVVRKNDHRRWAKGQRFDRRYATSYRVIDNYRGYRLNAPPRGYHWVRSGNDAVLVAITSGIIASVITGAIR